MSEDLVSRVKKLQVNAKAKTREAIKSTAIELPAMLQQQQLDFWVATGLPATPKDEIGSMEYPIFAVEDGDTRSLVYEHNGSKIEITPSVKGRATQHDKDIVLFCVSKLVAALNAGLDVTPIIETTAHELLVFTRSSTSQRGYDLLSSAFERLTGTRMIASIPATQGREGSRRWFGLVESVDVITKGSKNRMGAIRIKVSDMTYQAALTMQVLTIPTEYFGMRSAIAKRIYELARKHCGDQGRWKISLELLLHKVGSNQPLKNFRLFVKKLAEAGPLLDYRLAYLPDEDAVIFYNLKDTGTATLVEKITKSAAVIQHRHKSSKNSSLR